MPFDLPYWSGIAALISGMVDVINLGVPLSEAIALHRRDPRNARLALVLQSAFSTYSDDEVRAIEDRIKSCRERFMAEGSGERRAACLCSVLRDVKDGNGGDLPAAEWEDIFSQLKCA